MSSRPPYAILAVIILVVATTTASCHGQRGGTPVANPIRDEREPSEEMEYWEGAVPSSSAGTADDDSSDQEGPEIETDLDETEEEAGGQDEAEDDSGDDAEDDDAEDDGVDDAEDDGGDDAGDVEVDDTSGRLDQTDGAKLGA